MRTFLKKNSIKNFLFFIILSCLGQSPLAAMEEDSAEEITFLAAHRAWDGRVKVLSEKDGEVPIDGEYDYVLYFKNKDVIDIIFDDCGVAYWAFCFYSADPDLSKQIQDYQKQGQSLSTLFEEEKASFSNQEVRFQSNQSLFSALSASMVAQESLSHAGGDAATSY